MDRPKVRICEANTAYPDVTPARLPLVLAQLHTAMAVGAPLDIQVALGDHAGSAPEAMADVLVGAGFEPKRIEVPAGQADMVRARAVRAHTLADTVGPGMRLLVCGLNPSLYAAERGVGYARPGNRFWPAALAAGLVTRPRDPFHALAAHGVGMTDLVKRATVRAAELDAEEYRAGAARVERLVRWLAPRAVCFVGLSGWRAAVDRRAVAGWQPAPFAGRPAYVMPSTSGLNAHTSTDQLAQHLVCAAGAPEGPG